MTTQAQDPGAAPGRATGQGGAAATERADGTTDETTDGTGAEPQRVLTPLVEPRDGVPAVVTDPAALADAVAALRAGTGPVAVDAERASGHRYGQRAFLVQLRREGTGTLLLDPAALPDLSAVGEALRGVPWVLHAASQDLPCLAEVGMRPDELVDTELGGRLAGYARVGLAAMVEELLGLSLAKEHSAVDWSTRPLPAPWLRYAALDVEVLLELATALTAELERQGKTEWARQEFAAVVAAPPSPPRVDPWRRTSGMHRVRTRRQLATVRELWVERDALARERDVSPGRLLPDSAVVEAAMSGVRTAAALAALPGFTGRGAHRYVRRWADALQRAHAVEDADLPPQHLPHDGPPPPRSWPERDPDAAARLAAARTALAALAEEHGLPVENVLSPDTVRRLMWSPPADGRVVPVLEAAGARPWQVALTSVALEQALTARAAAAGEPAAVTSAE